MRVILCGAETALAHSPEQQVNRSAAAVMLVQSPNKTLSGRHAELVADVHVRARGASVGTRARPMEPGIVGTPQNAAATFRGRRASRVTVERIRQKHSSWLTTLHRTKDISRFARATSGAEQRMQLQLDPVRQTTDGEQIPGEDRRLGRRNRAHHLQDSRTELVEGGVLEL